MQELGFLVAESKSLSELDISWNVLKPQSYNTLLAGLSTNKTLLTLNLSWNRIVDSTETVLDTPKKILYTTQSSMRDSQDGDNLHIKEVQWYEKEA